MTNHERMIIAGPCAAETREQVLECTSALKERGIDKMRASLWKPRTKPTKPGFDGVGLDGVAWFAKVTNLGITIGTEIMLPDQVNGLIGRINEHNGNPANLLLWLGSRNQNHMLQQEIARRILGEAPPEVKLLIKNQPWSNEEHWLGIVEHIVNAGMGSKRLILCHRGFAPNGVNPNNFRNLPDFEMAMRVREQTELPMLFDPSHVGGSVENVFKAVKMATEFDFDGLMIEVHPTPSHARTDSKQQLTFQELDKLLALGK